MASRISRSLLRRMLRPLGWSPVAAVFVLALGVATATAGGPRPDAPPATPATGAPRPEAPPVTRAASPTAPRPPRPVHTPVAVAPGRPLPTRVEHVESAPRRQPVHPTTTRVVAPARSRPAPAVEPPPLVRFPRVPTLHPEASDGETAGSYSLVGLAAGLLLLGSCSLAITVAELRREPA